MSRGRAVVIGGGVAGLASAALLARDGYEVDLLEKNPQLGGRAGSWSSGGFRFDTGPSWYLMPEVFDHFFKLLGTSATEQLDLVRLDPAYRVFGEGYAEPLDIRADKAANIEAFEAAERGAGVRLEAYLDSAKDTYDIAVRRFLYSTYQSLPTLLRPDVVRRAGRLARLLVQPLGRFVAGYVSDRRLAQVLGYPSVFLGSSPDRAPSMYHLMSHLDLADGVLYPQGGFVRIIESLTRLAEAEGARIHTNATVTAISTSSAHGRSGHAVSLPLIHRAHRCARITGVRYQDAAGLSRSLVADVVVGATDLHHVETQLLPRPLQTYPQRWWDRRQSGPGAVLVHLGVTGLLPQLPHHSLFFTRDWATNFEDIFGSHPRVPIPASAYVGKPSATDVTVAPAGCEILFLLVPVPADPAIGRGGADGGGDPAVERIADAAIDQVAAWAGISDLRDRIVVRRTVGPQDFVTEVNAWSGGALGLAHTTRQSGFLRGRNVSARVAGLYYVGHSTIPGIGLPMCLISAEILIKALHADHSTEALPEPLQAVAARTPRGAAR